MEEQMDLLCFTLELVLTKFTTELIIINKHLEQYNNPIIII